MPFYVRRKVYEAVQWSGKNVTEVSEFLFFNKSKPIFDNKKVIFDSGGKKLVIEPTDFIVQDGETFFRFPEKLFHQMFTPERD